MGKDAVPTLADLAAKKVIEGLAKSDHPVDDFGSMKEHEQRILFAHIWKDHLRLLEVESRYDLLTGRLPTADRAVITHNGDRIPEPECADDGANGHIIKEGFQERWQYGELSYQRAGSADLEGWDDPCRSTDDAGRGFGVCECGSSASPYSALLDKHARLYDSISSQLLYYRLTVVFGQPPPEVTDGYKSAWEISLLSDDKQSSLYLQDYKGSALASFTGSAEGSAEALKLLDWLISDNVPHTYDGCLAGCQA